MLNTLLNLRWVHARQILNTNTRARSTLMRTKQQQMQWINSLNTKNDHMMELFVFFSFIFFLLNFCITFAVPELHKQFSSNSTGVIIPLRLLVLRRNTIMDSYWRREECVARSRCTRDFSQFRYTYNKIVCKIAQRPMRKMCACVWL